MRTRITPHTFPLAALLGLCIATPAFADQTIYWADFASTPTGVLAPPLIGAPDLAYQSDPALAAKFARRVDYPTLAAKIGLSDAAFASYELIAWEGNGGGPGYSGGFESVNFVFDDFRSAVTARYDEVSNLSSSPAVRFLTGSITGGQYDATFGTSGAAPVMSWILVDLPAVIDARSPSFSVKFAPGGLSAGGLGEGTPDVDAIGVIGAVPEPGAWGLLGLGLALLAGMQRRRMQQAGAPGHRKVASGDANELAQPRGDAGAP